MVSLLSHYQSSFCDIVDIFVHVGSKIFYMIPPTIENLQLFEEWLGSKKQLSTFFADKVPKNCFEVILTPSCDIALSHMYSYILLLDIGSSECGRHDGHSIGVDS